MVAMPIEDELRKSWKLPRGLHVRLRERLIDAGAEHAAHGKFEQWRLLLGVESARATVILYASGACAILSGHPPASDLAVDLIQGVIYEGTEAELRTDVVADLQTTLPAGPHIGADESGKGDYFGPLVCGAVCADHELMQKLIALGVRDCKKLSDGKVSTLAIEIDRIARQRVAVTILEPEDYNRKYDGLKKEGKNLTDLLAWAHARCIEELALGDFRQRPKSVLIDRFATRLIETLVPATHWGLEVFQVYEAEADAAVAAASIVARAKFLEWMNAASERLGIKLPKGTDSKGRVVEVARVIAARDGAETLRGLVKLHHKTTEKVLGRGIVGHHPAGANLRR